MTKTKRNFKSIFKTFALAFTTLALMLGVFLGNAMPNVKAEESAFEKYYTAEKLEEIKISTIKELDTSLGNKHLLFDITDYDEFLVNYPLFDCAGQNPETENWGQVTFYFDNNIVRSPDISTEDYRWKYFIGGDGREYVYLYLENFEDFYEAMIFRIDYSWYISEPIVDEPVIEDEPVDVPTDEPTVEPDEPTVEPDEPTDDNNQEDNSSDVVEEEKDGFVEMLGNTAIEVFALENISAYSAGIATIGSFVAFIVVAGTAIAIIAVSKKR